MEVADVVLSGMMLLLYHDIVKPFPDSSMLGGCSLHLSRQGLNCCRYSAIRPFLQGLPTAEPSCMELHEDGME